MIYEEISGGLEQNLPYIHVPDMSEQIFMLDV